MVNHELWCYAIDIPYGIDCPCGHNMLVACLEPGEETLTCPNCQTEHHFIWKPLPMSTSPQAVTERYVSNLLRDGQNAEFRLVNLQIRPWVVDEEACGWYYFCIVETVAGSAGPVKEAVGVTPVVALRNALTKLGVTFR